MSEKPRYQQTERDEAFLHYDSVQDSGSAYEQQPKRLPQWGAELWHTIPDDEALLAVLTAAGCPAPCAGVVNETGWHLECEKRGREALAVLRGWVTAASDSDDPAQAPSRSVARRLERSAPEDAP